MNAPSTECYLVCFYPGDRSDLVTDLRVRLEGAERQLTEMEADRRDTSAALREELALRSSQIADLTSQLLQAKRTIVEQEVSRSV